MAISVDVAKDPTSIKPKFIGFLTRRQVICFGAGAAIGIPFYRNRYSSTSHDRRDAPVLFPCDV